MQALDFSEGLVEGTRSEKTLSSRAVGSVMVFCWCGALACETPCGWVCYCVAGTFSAGATGTIQRPRNAPEDCGKRERRDCGWPGTGTGGRERRPLGIVCPALASARGSSCAGAATTRTGTCVSAGRENPCAWGTWTCGASSLGRGACLASWTSSSWAVGGGRGCNGAGLGESIAWVMVSGGVGAERETVALVRAICGGGVGMGNVFSLEKGLWAASVVKAYDFVSS